MAHTVPDINYEDHPDLEKPEKGSRITIEIDSVDIYDGKNGPFFAFTCINPDNDNMVAIRENLNPLSSDLSEKEYAKRGRQVRRFGAGFKIPAAQMTKAFKDFWEAWDEGEVEEAKEAFKPFIGKTTKVITGLRKDKNSDFENVTIDSFGG